MFTTSLTSYVTTVWSISTICIIETSTATMDFQREILQYAKAVRTAYLAVVSNTVLELLMSLTAYMKEYAKLSKGIQKQKKKEKNNNNEGYIIKIKQTIKREVESTLADHRQLLKLALVSLIESLRKDPGKFHALYYNMYSCSAKSSPSSSSATTGYGGQEQYNHVPFMNEQQHL
jgi:hypothetical protein